MKDTRYVFNGKENNLIPFFFSMPRSVHKVLVYLLSENKIILEILKGIFMIESIGSFNIVIIQLFLLTRKSQEYQEEKPD